MAAAAISTTLVAGLLVALLSVIGPAETLRQAGIGKSLLANFRPCVGAAAFFLAVTIPATRYADRLIASQRRRS